MTGAALYGLRGFAVPPAADVAFIAAWREAEERCGTAAPALFRALRADVALRFVALARLDAAGEDERHGGVGGLAAPGDDGGGAAGHREPDGARGLPAPALDGRYAVVREDGDLDGAGGVLLIAPYAVPSGDDERFLAARERLREQHAAQRGHIGTRLLCSTAPADHAFVDLARWSSPLMYARALREPDVQAAALPFAGAPALYLRVGPDG